MRLLILLSTAILFVIYSSCFFWQTLIDTTKLSAAGDAIYNFIQTETDLPRTVTNVTIPRVIHRMWANDDFLNEEHSEMTQHFNHCLDIYNRKQWKTILWSDESIQNFIQMYYPAFISTFEAYPFTIQRVDAARYFILYHFGGVYMDMDIGCFATKDIGEIVKVMEASGKYAALPKTQPIGLSNDVMFASRNSPFFKKAIDVLPTKNRWFGIHYLTVLYSTGSLYASLLYLNLNPTEQRQIAIIPPQLYSEKGTRFFQHLHGSSWHNSGEWVLRYFYDFGFEFALLFILLLLLLIRFRPLRRRKKQSKQT